MADVIDTTALDEDVARYIASATTVALAVIPIWIGSYLSVHILKESEKGGPNASKPEAMSKQDAWMFPLVGSCVLFGLYILFKVFSQEYINMLLTAYFMLFGTGAVAATAAIFLSFVLPSQSNDFKISVPFYGPFKFNYVDVIGLVAALGLSAWYLQGKHWIASNMFGLSFSVQGVALISLGSYSVGCILLTGLFFYDIYWVFFTEVMVTVAKSFDAPIKLLIPKDFFASQYQFSMLGLGDIVIPGIFVALLLRYDYSRSNKQSSFSFPKPYFRAVLTGYVAGLALTIFVMHFFNSPQPALLYLVPCCMGSSFLTALLRGEVTSLLDYKEGEDEKDKDGKKKDNQDSNKSD